MNPADEKVLRALIHLEDNEDFIELVRWFKKTQQAVQSEARDLLDEVRLRWCQGKLQLLEDLIEHIEEARLEWNKRR